LARAYFEHRKAISKIHPRYRFLCPTECEKGGFNPKRLKKCEGCALYAPEKEFRSKVLKAWKRKLRRHSFTFEKMFSVLSTISGLEGKPKSEISAKNYQILNVFLSEKNFSEAKDDHAEWMRLNSGQ
jgi:hypothetical protein